MAAKAASWIGTEKASLVHLSTIFSNNNPKTRTTISATVTTSRSITTTTRKHGSLSFGMSYFSFPKAPFSTIRANSRPNSNDPDSFTKPNNSSSLQDDLIYLLRLAIGSAFGAAVIKYGSAAVPDITKPNLILALLMISSPMVAAVLLLIKGSGKK